MHRAFRPVLINAETGQVESLPARRSQVTRLLGHLSFVEAETRFIMVIYEVDSRVMSDKTEVLVDAFTSQLQKQGVTIRREDNASQLRDLEARLPKRLPPSFESLLSRYSFPSFEASGISFFGWGPASTELVEVASPSKGSLSELLLPAGYFQFGRPDTGSFDAICFDMNTLAQNREYRIVLADHEEILSKLRVKIRSELWSSLQEFLKMVSSPG
jgi:hypothetical protein